MIENIIKYTNLLNSILSRTLFSSLLEIIIKENAAMIQYPPYLKAG